jgi:hypothetical protein
LAQRNLDDLVVDTEHARPVHPWRALIENHCYLDSFVDLKQSGLSLLLMDGLILIPIVMFAFFYPLQTLMWVGGVVLVVAVFYESFVIWRKRHPARS